MPMKSRIRRRPTLFINASICKEILKRCMHTLIEVTKLNVCSELSVLYMIPHRRRMHSFGLLYDLLWLLFES